MTLTERENLAQAYMSAWYAVKGRPVTVKILPNGWFEKRHEGYSFPENVRASYLLATLVRLTQRLEARTKAATA